MEEKDEMERDADWADEMSEALRHIARDEELKSYVLQNTRLYDVALRAARRYIGGETLSDCLHVAERLRDLGFLQAIDFMGESTRSEDSGKIYNRRVPFSN